MLTYPDIDPVAVALGPIKMRWYGLMYLAGFAAAWLLARHRAAKPTFSWTREQADDLIIYAALGLIIGARVGYILFYGLDRVLANPLSLLRLLEGGMSFHGGLVGVMLAVWLLGRRQERAYWDMTDFVVPLCPSGLFAGRVGNFINGELWGKTTDVPWAFDIDGVGRHPSQLYEAFLEGLVLFAIVWIFSLQARPRMAVSGLFLMCYGIFRFGIEFIRVPDAHLGYLAFGWVTMGQILSTPMILLGAALLILGYRYNIPSGNRVPGDPRA